MQKSLYSWDPWSGVRPARGRDRTVTWLLHETDIQPPLTWLASWDLLWLLPPSYVLSASLGSPTLPHPFRQTAPSSHPTHTQASPGLPSTAWLLAFLSEVRQTHMQQILLTLENERSSLYWTFAEVYLELSYSMYYFLPVSQYYRTC